MSDAPTRLINTFDQLMAAADTNLLPKKHLLAICMGEHGVYVYSPFFKTEPHSAWYKHHRKTFYGVMGIGNRARTASAVTEAVAWVQETYGYTGPWAGNAMQDKVPEIVQKKFPIKRRKNP